MKEATVFWKKAGIPTKEEIRCVEHSETLYRRWRNLQKRAGKSFNAERENTFVSDIKKLFDIARGDVMTNKYVSQKKKDFLENQRRDTRLGFIGDVASFDFETIRLRNKEIMRMRLERSKR